MDSFALFIAILACVTALFTCLITDSAVRTIPVAVERVLRADSRGDGGS